MRIKLSKKFSSLEQVLACKVAIEKCEQELSDSKNLLAENSDQELLELARQDIEKLNKNLEKLYNNLKKLLIPKGFFMCVNRWSKATDFWLYPYFLFKNFKTMIFDEVLTSRHSSMSKIIVKKLIRLTNN